MMLRLTGQPYNLFTSRDATLLFDVPLDGGQYVLALSAAGELLQPEQIFAYFNEYSSVPFLLVPLLLVLWLPTLLVTIYAARLARRIRGLSTAVGSVDLETPAVIPGDASHDEIGQLTRRFQAMSDALQEQFARVRRVQEARRTLVANLSHDLRTPLASILGYAETLQQNPGDGAGGVNRYATIIAQRARYMDRLLDHLFEASLLDRPDGALEMRPHNIGLLVEQVVVEYAALLEDRRIHLDLELPARPVSRNVNDWSLQQVVRNLIDNALAYGGEGGYLGVRVAETAADVIIAVTDGGRGIPAGEEERIFEPFYRLEAGRRGGNVGFGLSLAREVVARHGGRIWVESTPYVSTVFTIELPKHRQASPST